VPGTLAPGDNEITDFLRGLRKYRRALSGPSQVLLDSLIAAGLGWTLDQAPEAGIRHLWSAYAAGPYGGSDNLGGPGGAAVLTWETTPWSLAWRTRYG
jgi:hypothetical protein